MPCRASLRAVLASIYILNLVNAAGASPTLAFPINSQVPPVARILEPYRYTFASSTFVSSSHRISYLLKNQPQWLTLDSSSRTLTGIPQLGDAGANCFQLVAEDSTGSTAANVTLVVVHHGGPVLDQPLLSQLEEVGRTSSPATLYMYPLRQFSFAFVTETFANITPQTQFYSTSADNSPLASWIQFDSELLTFSGLSPPLTSPMTTPQTYGINLIASNVLGFSEAVATFDIVVGYHILAFSHNLQTFNVTPGHFFESPPLLDQLTLDSRPLDATELTHVTSNAPDWMSLDIGEIKLSGIPPTDMLSKEIIITVRDVWEDFANITLFLEAMDSKKIFTATIPDLVAVTGRHFHYTLNKSIFTQISLYVSANLGNTSSWLKFDNNTFSFTGIVPRSDPTGTTTIVVTAFYENEAEVQTFNLTVITPAEYLAAHSTAAQSVAAPASQPSPTQGLDSGNHPEAKSRTKVIVLAATLPPVFMIALLILLLVLIRNYRHRQALTGRSSSPEDSNSRSQQEIISQRGSPRPLDTSDNQSVLFRPLSSSLPPKIDLSWTPTSLRTMKTRVSQKLRTPSDDSIGSSWVDLAVPALNFSQSRVHIRSNAERIQQSSSTKRIEGKNGLPSGVRLSPTQPGRALSMSKKSAFNLHRAGTNIGLPKRLSGAGHGAGELSPTGELIPRSSWRTTFEFTPTIDKSQEILNMTTEASGLPHAEVGKQMPSFSSVPGATIRLIRGDNATPRGSAGVWKRQAADIGRRQQVLTQMPDGGAIANENRTMSEHINLGRETSALSSGQFSSALSSDSAWEDENLTEGVGEEERRSQVLQGALGLREPLFSQPPCWPVCGSMEYQHRSSGQERAEVSNDSDWQGSRSRTYSGSLRFV